MLQVRTPSSIETRHSGSTRKGVSRITVQRVNRKWQLVLWYGQRPTLQMSSRGEIRQWRRIANALDYAAKHYPHVASFQLLLS